MKPIWFLALNFVRQQRIVVFVFLAWLLGFGILFGVVFSDAHNSDDLLALFRQEAAYGVVITVFVSASAIHGERKSRRIVAVLSKGIYRAEYLAGVMLGNVLLVGMYFGVVGVINQALAVRFGFEVSIWPTLVAALVASMLASSMALFLGTFLNPLVATILTMAVLGAPFAFHFSLPLIPVAYVLTQIMDADYARGWQGGWQFAWVAGLEMVVLFAAATAVFSRKDVTVAVE
jgi:hypothetical protein